MTPKTRKAKKGEESSFEQHSPPILKTSPYVRQPVTLRIGPELRSYYVSKDLLQNPDWIASCSCSWMPTTTIDLPELDEDVGHTLVHYLYTGTYETIGTLETLPNHYNRIQFKRAVSICDVAQTYHLLGLQKLATKEADRLGMDLDIFEAVETVAQALKKSPRDVVWLSGYLRGKIEAAFREDHTTFVKRSLFNSSSNSDLNSFLAECVISLCSDKISGLLATEHGTPREGPETFAQDAGNEGNLAGSEDGLMSTKDLHPADQNVFDEELTQGDQPVSAGHCTEEPFLSSPSDSCNTACLTPASSLVADSGFEIISTIAEEFVKSVPCSHRAEHLLDDGWKECSQCRAFVRHINSQLDHV